MQVNIPIEHVTHALKTLIATDLSDIIVKLTNDMPDHWKRILIRRIVGELVLAPATQPSEVLVLDIKLTIRAKRVISHLVPDYLRLTAVNLVDKIRMLAVLEGKTTKRFLDEQPRCGLSTRNHIIRALEL